MRDDALPNISSMNLPKTPSAIHELPLVENRSSSSCLASLFAWLKPPGSQKISSNETIPKPLSAEIACASVLLPDPLFPMMATLVSPAGSKFHPMLIVVRDLYLVCSAVPALATFGTTVQGAQILQSTRCHSFEKRARNNKSLLREPRNASLSKRIPLEFRQAWIHGSPGLGVGNPDVHL